VRPVDKKWWTLIAVWPGFVLLTARLGAGLVNPPLASTAIAVVPPERPRMASGVDSTFRQVGIGRHRGSRLGLHLAIGRHLPGALPPSLAGSAPRW
jgi:hypothetical protein